MNRCWLAGALLIALGGCGGGSENKSTGNAGNGTSASAGSGAASDTGASPTVAAGPAADVSALYAGVRQPGKLMLHQRGALAVTPERLRARIGAMDASLSAFDGVFLHLPVSTDAVMKNAPLDAAAIAADLAPLAGLPASRLRHHFAVINAKSELDAFDDWSVVARNIGQLARAARAAGLVGVVIDNESARVAYPADAKFASTVSLASYQAQTQSVAKRLMDAMTAEFADIAVVVLRGPAAAEPQTPAQLALKAVGSAQLLGSFFAGMVEGKGSRTLLVDGGSDYGLRTDEQFSASRAWRTSGIATPGVNSAFVGSTLRPLWPAAVSASFGVRENDGARGDHMPNRPEIWESTLASAVRRADAFAWASFDHTDMTSVGADHVWAVASQRAKAAALDSTVRRASSGPGTGTGLTAQYFADVDQIELAQTLVDGVIDHELNDSGYTPSNYPQSANYSIVWSGELEAEVSGEHTFYSTTDDGMRITLGGVRIIGTDADNAFRYQGATEYSAKAMLQAGQRYPIKIEFFQGGGAGLARVEWEAAGLPRAVLPSNRLYLSR